MSTDSPPISVQLYSVREEAAHDFEGVVRRIGEIGFVGVELAGFHGLTPRRFAVVAEEAGLVASSAHVPALSPDALNAALDDLQEIGCDVAVCAFIPAERFADLDSIQLRRRAERGERLAKVRGVSLGYHNHWWEFSTISTARPHGRPCSQRLDPSVFAELDIYWATFGGADPRQVIADLGGRLRLLHVKDGPCDDAGEPDGRRRVGHTRHARHPRVRADGAVAHR